MQPDLDGDGRSLLELDGTQYAPDGPRETSWVDPAFDDPEVDYTARYVYDYHYQGAGNWPFNTAYAAERGLVSDVTQLHNLREAEPFIRAGIPLVASVAWESNKLDGGDQEHERPPDGDRRVHGQRRRDRLRPGIVG